MPGYGGDAARGKAVGRAGYPGAEGFSTAAIGSAGLGVRHQRLSVMTKTANNALTNFRCRYFLAAWRNGRGRVRNVRRAC